jgi:cell division protein FtsL
VLRLLHLLVIGCLVAAAVVLYQVKYESTAYVQRIAKLRTEVRSERERIAALRAEWTRLASPDRIQDLARRHLSMAPQLPVRMEEMAALPDKPDLDADPIGDLIAALDPPAPAYDRDGLSVMTGGIR